MDLPPLPTVDIIPFNFFDGPSEDPSVPVEPNFDIATRDDFEILKEKTNKYIDNLHNILDDMFSKNPNDYVVYYSYLKQKEERDKRMSSTSSNITQDKVGGNLPTSILYHNALEKASEIIEEVDRSRRDNQLRMGLFPKPVSSTKKSSTSKVRVDPILFSSKSPDSRLSNMSPPTTKNQDSKLNGK